MADKKISELNSLTGANAADGDLVAIVDVSATETKKITRSEFFTDTPSIDVGGTVTATGFVTTGDMTFGDNDKAIFGAGSDLQIYHDGSNSYISDIGTGDLYIQAGNEIFLQNTAGVTYFYGNQAGQSTVGYAGSTKLATTATGIDVTGTVTADGLGIGASSPSSVIDARQTSTSASTQIRVYNTDNSNTTTQTAALFLSPDSRGNGALIFAEKENADFSTTAGRDVSLVFSPVLNNSQTQAMRIDSSGNLLVGKTSDASAVTTDGINLRPGGYSTFTATSKEALQLSRQGTEGDIVDFYKDGVTVGSIGVSNSNNLYIYGAAANHSGLNFGTSQILPARDSATQDATVDLGSSTTRFKDLYLSGGVYLGGTGSANKLDDYEEGEFDVTISTSTSGTITINPSYNRMSYTKIGNVVTINGELRVSSVSSPVGSDIRIDGLPFLSINLGDFAGRAGGGFYYYDASSGNQSVLPMRVTEVETRIRLSIDASTITTNDEFGFSFSYMTAS